MKLDNQVAFITGGGSGIGEACALTFAKAGAAVAVADYNAAAALKTVHAIESAGGKAIRITVDVTQEEAVRMAVAQTVEQLGRLDCAVNCAGIANVPKPMADITQGEWRPVMELDLMGVVYSMRYQIMQMLAQKGGSIVNISSGAGLMGVGLMAPYVAAKHSVIGLTRSAAIDYGAQGIRVNAVCPGLIDTPMSRASLADGVDWSQVIKCPIGRLGRPEEIADVALFLCSARSSFVTGQSIPVDGGLITF